MENVFFGSFDGIKDEFVIPSTGLWQDDPLAPLLSFVVR
jgi:hypothetical protein